jgi:SAM-dependent methyltransferase
MAPDLAIATLRELKRHAVVLDPMAGSGTVVRQAAEFGHRAIGFDLDPLAVLMTKVWTIPVDDEIVARLASEVLAEAEALHPRSIELPWIDHDDETRRFIESWFAEPQRSDLRRISYLLSHLDRPRLRFEKRAAAEVLRLALSRIIVTKDRGASLARDVSHKAFETSDFEVIPAFERSVQAIRKLLTDAPPPGNVDIRLGDARNLASVGNAEVDAVLTSPPYLNAIDYMRGHRLSLVWLGHRVSDLRHIRANSIDSERAPNHPQSAHLFKDIQEPMGAVEELSSRRASMVARYSEDIYRLMSEVARVLKPTGRAILVVGNSCLKGAFIQNSGGVIKAASMVGLRLIAQFERDLPNCSRYLPISPDKDEPLGKRMRTETILTFVPA